MNEQSANQQILLSTAYFPPISYLKAIVRADNVFIEQHENYIKKSYRNRCNIFAANGVLSLTVPVVMATSKKINVKNVRIDYATNWQKQHFKSIESAYRSSPYYEYLIDDFISFFEKKYKFLLDFNLEILQNLFKILELGTTIQLSLDYEHEPNDCLDLRNEIHPKNENNFKQELKPYQQVFADKYGFQKDLSCLDLLFCIGAETYSYIIDKY